ncbi:MAG: hypothetical protein HXX17_03685 [Geobacteraceae bacterium]|nr:hypothetical protein [Geobacteraceae bacterium]
MRCLCPKCSTNIELDIYDLPEEGSFNKCPECNSGYVVKKVSFASRALHKDAEITCVECGNNPGTSVYCHECHAIYPDFYITESSSAAKKQFNKFIGSFSRFNKLSAKHTSTTQYTDYGIKSTAGTKGLKLPSQPAQIAAILAIIILVIGAGGYFLYQDRIETKYAERYVRALFGIKSATDLDMKICNRILTEWQSTMAPNPPKATRSESASMASASKDVSSMVKDIGEPPTKFAASNEHINKIFAAYTKIHTFAANPSGSITSYTATVKQLDDEFKNSARLLKAGLPEKISDKLIESKKKYKPLQDF